MPSIDPVSPSHQTVEQLRPTTREVIRGNRSPARVLQVHSDLHDRGSHAVELFQTAIREAIGGNRSPARVLDKGGYLHHESVDCRNGWNWRLDGDPFCCGTTRKCRPPTRLPIDVVNGGTKDTSKHAIALGGCVAQEVNAGESIAPHKRFATDECDATGDGNTCQPTAPIERSFADGGEATGEGNACKFIGSIESVCPDRGHR